MVHLYAEKGEVLQDQPVQRRVQPAVVHGGGAGNGHLSARSQRARTGAIPDARVGGLQLFGGIGPHHELRGCPLGDDIRGLPSIGDDAVHADLGMQLLAQGIDVVEGQQ